MLLHASHCYNCYLACYIIVCFVFYVDLNQYAKSDSIRKHFFIHSTLICLMTKENLVLFTFSISESRNWSLGTALNYDSCYIDTVLD